MVLIEKKRSENGYCFTITTNEGKFEISFEGNLDLYWRNIYKGNLMNEPESKSFTITKENYYLYSLFEVLYEDIKNYNVHKLDEIDISFCEDWEEIDDKRRKIQKMNNNLKTHQKYNPRRLFHNGYIEWHCDDFPYDKGGIVKIESKKDTFIVTIEKSKVMDMNLTYSVRFSNSGSRYEPFNIIFMEMYNKLIDYDPNYHQINMEDCLYHKKLERRIL